MIWLGVLKAEFLKYRRTSALFLALGIPLAINALFLLGFFLNGGQSVGSPKKDWEFFLGNLNAAWVSLFLPVGLGILASLVMGLEHTDNQWKQQLILGATRVQIYVGKWLAVFYLVLLGSLMLAFGSFLVGGVITGFREIPFLQILRAPLLALVGSIGIVSLQAWLALRFRAFGVGLGVALFGAIAGGLAGQSTRFWYFVPWSFPSSVLSDARLESAALLSLGLGLLLFFLGALDLERRDVL